MKKLITTSLALALAACGGDSDSGLDVGDRDGKQQIGGVSVSESSADNDNLRSAQEVNLGSTLTGSIGPSDYEDYFKFSVAAGQSIQIDLNGRSDVDIDLQLLDINYNELDYSYGDYSTERMTYTSDSSKTLYVAVEHISGPTSEYQLSFTSAGSVGSPGGTGDAVICVESITSSGSYFQVTDTVQQTQGNMQSGRCPNTRSNYVSKCEISFSGVETNTYFSQSYIDTVGSHAAVKSQVCLAVDQSGVYTIY